MKKLFKFMFAFVLCFACLNFVNAAGRPDTITITEGKSVGNIGDSTNVVKTVMKTTTIDGTKKYVYCMNHDATNPGSTTLSLITNTSKPFSNMNTFPGIMYLIEHPYTSSVAADGYTKEELDYYMTDMAILWYIDRKNGIEDTDSSKTYDNLPMAFKTAQGAYASYATKINAIKSMVEMAIGCENNYKLATVTASFDATKLNFTLSGDKYVSQAITLNTTNATSKVLTPATNVNVSSDTFTTDGKVKFTASVPSTTTGDVTITAKASRNNSSVYAYQTGTTQEVVLGVVYTTPQTVDVNITGTIGTTPTTPVVKISKLDVTGKKELPGATLVIKDASGEQVAEWVSTDEPYTITTLVAGQTYTLEETIAPKGYTIASSIKFTVKGDGTVTEVTMKDELEKVPAPDTGTIDIILIGLAVIALGGTGIYYCKKKNIFAK